MIAKNKIFRYFVDGVLWIKSYIKENGGERNGEHLEYYKNGKLYKRCNYKNDKLDGEYLKYKKNNDKLLREKRIYKDGALIRKVNVASINAEILKTEPINGKDI